MAGNFGSQSGGWITLLEAKGNSTVVLVAPEPGKFFVFSCCTCDRNIEFGKIVVSLHNRDCDASLTSNVPCHP